MKMLGVVTLYNTKRDTALDNIGLYAPHVDHLIVWDNSAVCHEAWFRSLSVDYHWTGQNTYIAPAINYAFNYARTHGFQMLLVMDDDSQWNDFAAYRKAAEHIVGQGQTMVFTPYVKGVDTFRITGEMQEKRLFINSGMIVPIEILQAIGGVDEEAFPLDALDHDIAFSIREHGYKAVCLTNHLMHHSLGYPQRLGPFRLFTPNYDRNRTYNMTRSHIICYRKHKALMTKEDKDYLYNEILRRKFLRIILAEPDKLGRLKSFIRGILSGCNYKLRKTDEDK